jgi:glycosyltransferase involved in cell wall biosynthesis
MSVTASENRTRRGPLAAAATSRTSLVPTVDIVIPVHNEEQDLALSVRRLNAFLDSEFPFSTRITIADNASTDGTRAMASELSRELPRVRLLHINQKGRGWHSPPPG